MNNIKNVEFLKTGLVAHRGFHDVKNKVPENSMIAFERSVRHGYTIELDVRLTKDDKIVVFHDASLKRACGVNKKVDDITYKELLNYGLFGTNYKIPLLKDVLRLVDGKVGLLIETKTSKKKRRLERKLSQLLDGYDGSFAVQSFNPFSLLWFKKHKKQYAIGILASDFKDRNDVNNLKKNICKNLVFDVLLKADFISYDVKALPNSYVDKRKNKKLILGWTVKSKQEYEKYLKYCDNLICDNIGEIIKK